MKGTIVSAWIKTCRNIYGDEITNEAMKKYGMSPDKIFTPMEDIDDKAAIGIVDYIAEKTNKTSFEAWKEMGKNNVLTFSLDYPAFFRYKNLYSFLRAMYDIHVVVTKRIPGAKPPILHVEPIGSKKASMTYSSPRGMFGYFEGMLIGASQFYNEKIDIETIEKTKDFMKIHITFPEEIYEHKDYKFNKALSFGFIKNLETKIGVASLLFIGIPYVILSKFANENILLPTTLALSFLVPFLISKGLFAPIKTIYRNLDEMENRNISIENTISTKDFFENINSKLNSIKANIKSDFVGYKGTTDELNVFADKFNDISTNMGYTSKEISNVVEQVAEGAVSQAEETEMTAGLLNDSMNSLNDITEKENMGKEDLETAVLKLNKGYENLKNTSKSLNNILGEFLQVKENGIKLQNRAKDVTKIVETVESISDKTNLLALNASIEASRAGEYGQGFTVVAMEIRKLAEGSKEAVKNINDNLVTFINEIDGFVEQIEKQYITLEKENNSLSNIANENYTTVMSIQNVSNLIIDLIENLNNETKSLNTISANIETLAAIAEENSASSEEVSANVVAYTEELNKMIENIKEFKKVSEQFGEDLERYIV